MKKRTHFTINYLILIFALISIVYTNHNCSSLKYYSGELKVYKYNHFKKSNPSNPFNIKVQKEAIFQNNKINVPDNTFYKNNNSLIYSCLHFSLISTNNYSFCSKLKDYCDLFISYRNLRI